MTVALYSVSSELANEHLDRHEVGCRDTSYYARVTYRCAHGRLTGLRHECETCGASLACIVDQPACEHLTES